MVVSMAFNTKTWFNRGNTTKTPINADGINDLEKRISDAFAKIIECDLTKDNGYVKFDNGFLMQWKSETVNGGGTQWGSFYYSDHSMGIWKIPFKTLFCSIPTVNSYTYWVTHQENSNLEYAGGIRCFRPTSSVDSIKITIIGFGTWK